MKIHRLAPVIGLSLLLFSTLLFLLATPTTAQEPPPPPKGSPYTAPPLEPTPSSARTVDPVLLAKIEPPLLKKLAIEGDSAAFIVYLKEQVDVAAVAGAVPLDAQGQPDTLARRTAIVSTLQQTANNSQGNVLQILNDAAAPGGLSGQSGATAGIRPLWIVNAVASKGSLETVLALAALSEVEIIRLDKEIRLNLPTPSGIPKSEAESPPSSPPTEKEVAWFSPLWGELEGGHQRLKPCPTGATTCRLSLQRAEQASFIPTVQTAEWGIAKIRADLVHNALGINGHGIVVANIDTGVDWLHPDLQDKYRGFTGQGHLPNHEGNWFDVTDDGAGYPIDGNGHGTHTMGTIVAASGKGVAPGAQWIAVKAFSSGGVALNSWLHNAFQWILAPNGDPALAPDVVNNSWSNSTSSSLEYEADVQALLNAGIYPVFSAGNNGPQNATLGSPASLDISLAVGAMTIDDEIANFSSRGPSPWGRIKPEVAAPGADVISTFPGGSYTSLNGTSMAAPHTTGLAALLLQANPNLGNNLPALSHAITSTTVPLGMPIPNNDFGWGRIDAYNAVMAVAGAGTLEGSVLQSGGGLGIGNAVVTITPRNGGPTVNTTSSSTGTYIQGLASDTYDATATAFGYEPLTIFNLSVVTGTATFQNFILTPAPTGQIQGQILEQGSNTPLAATITLDGTPLSISSDPTDGSYSLTVPVGTYTITVVAPAHRVGKAFNITVNDGATIIQDFALASSPKILLIDSGRWYQESEISFFQQALDDALYPYETHPILDPFGVSSDVPISTTLSSHDIVIWSSPLDSPGYIDAELSIVDFLEAGGKLLLSGQDIGFFDGGGSLFNTTNYFATHLNAKYVADAAASQSISGSIEGPMAGLALSIADGDGANNQSSPDVVTVANPDFGGPLLTYGAEGLAGIHVGTCVPYRALYLSFGLEGVNSRADRQQLMEQSLAWLQSTPPANGVELAPITRTVVGNFGSTVDQTVRLRNTGTNNDNYSLSFNSSNWPVNPAPPANVSLETCQSQVITIGVQVDTSQWNISDTLTLNAQSNNNPALTASVTRTTKSPAPLLVIDDDRFFDVGQAFRSALAANDIAYDYYEVPKSWAGAYPPTPDAESLQWYPTVIWFTGYDWFQPITPEDQNRLASYLENGGRLLLTSQDMIYNLPDNTPDPFTQNYLGVAGHVEDFSSTSAVGQRGNPISNQLGSAGFTFLPPEYQNHTDALTPTTTAQVVTMGDKEQINGVMNQGQGSSGRVWRTNFLAYGPELLSEADRIPFLRRSVGWLSWLGSSNISATPADTLDGEQVTYTAVVTNDGWADIDQAYFTVTLPSALSLNSHSPGLTPVGDDLVWSGPLAKNEQKAFFYTATLADPLPIGTVVTQTSWLYNQDHQVGFDRITEVYVNFPEITQSRLSVSPTQDVLPGDTLTYTLVLKNSGLVDDPQVVATNNLPHMLHQLKIISVPGKGNAVTDGKTLTWTTALSVNEEAILTYSAVISYRSSTPIDNVVRVDDQLNPVLKLTTRTFFEVYPLYFPLIFR